MEQILGANGFPMDGALVVLGHIIHNIVGQTACCTKVCSEVLQQPWHHQSARNHDPAYQLPSSLLLIFVLVHSPNLLGEIFFPTICHESTCEAWSYLSSLLNLRMAH
jgi:hypothetical protein